MACINSALVGSTWVFFSYIQIKSLPELNFIFSWDPNHLLSCFWQDIRPCGKAIKHFNPHPFSTGMALLSETTNVPGTRTRSKLLPCKTRKQISLFISLKATAFSFHIFGDLEDFSWTDSKWSSFSYKERNIKTKSTH